MPMRDPKKDISGIGHLFPEKTWAVNERGLPDSECKICRGTVFWMNHAKKYLCATCHPAPQPGIVKEWVELDADDDAMLEELWDPEAELALSGESGRHG